MGSESSKEKKVRQVRHGDFTDLNTINLAFV